MSFTFYKYNGTGNDFVIVDNRTSFFPKNDIKLIGRICDRNFGVGADGLILLEEYPNSDFYMTYFNADGMPGTMCGNGGRCIVHFARKIGLIEEKALFTAVDGLHIAMIQGDEISLKMNDVDSVNLNGDHVYINTGSPHHIQFVKDIDDFDVKRIGANIRYNIYGKEGSNVNFAEQIKDDLYSVRTYERGVEDETLSCGTGVTAVALAIYETKRSNSKRITFKTKGGLLNVKFQQNEGTYSEIYLIGPASLVYTGEWI